VVQWDELESSPRKNDMYHPIKIMDIRGHQLETVVKKGFMVWDITPYSPVKVNTCFGRSCRLQLQC
jgi:hypothetical protein